MKLSPLGWALRPLKRYGDFSGRSSRAEFWWFFLFTMLTYLLLAFAVGLAVGGMSAMGPGNGGLALAAGAFGLMMILYWLALLVPMMAVQVRRLHDTNRSGWWMIGYYLLYGTYLLMTVGGLFSAGPNMTAAMRVGGLSSIVFVVFAVYSVAVLIFFCLPGTKGANRFGEDPYGAD